MHEHHLLKDLLNDLLKRAEEEKIGKITDIYIRMGEFTEINPEILKHFLAETGAIIHIEKSKTRELTLLSFDGE